MSAPTIRKLAAIVSTDVVGYSRLIGADEAGTLARMKAHRAALWDPEIEKHGGRIVGSAGDSLLVEFASAVAAVECALAVQKAMAEREAGRPDDARMLLRIGVNIGEVVVDGDDIHGDGVNVAARLQAIAPAGGICLSGKVHEEVEGKIAATFEDAGTQEVKNIARPVQVWRWTAGQRPAAAPAPGTGHAPTLPDKPSIAVLPFDNMSGDAGIDHVCDGLSETIISAIAKLPYLLVIARNSSFAYRGRATSVRRIGGELGARYVLEGSVQMSGGRVRVTAQLIDATDEGHVWSETYNRAAGDILEVMDDITREIFIALDIELAQGEQARLHHRTTSSLEAIGEVSRGNALFHRYTREDNARAIAHYARALEHDPNYAAGWAFLASAHWIDAVFGFAPDPAKAQRLALDALERARSIDENIPEIYQITCLLLSRNKRYDEALALGRRAVGLFPNSALLHAVLAVITLIAGHWEETVRLAQMAVRLQPIYSSWYLKNMIDALIFMGETRAAIATADKALARAESDGLRAGYLRSKALAYAEAGDAGTAQALIAESQALMPITIAELARFYNFRDPAHLQRLQDGFRAAGLPES